TVCPSRTSESVSAVPTSPLDPVITTFMRFSVNFTPASGVSCGAGHKSRYALRLARSRRVSLHRRVGRALAPLALADRRAAGYNSPVSSVTPAIQVKVLFFGRLREVAGGAEESVELPPGSRIEELFATFVA